MADRRGWDESSDALARRVLARARDTAFSRGHRPVRAKEAPWEMATYGPVGGAAAGAAGAAGSAGATAHGAASGTGAGGTATGTSSGTAAEEQVEGVSPSGWRPPPGLGDLGSGPGPSRRDPQTLGGLTARVLVEHGWHRPVAVAGVVGRWPQIVGEQLAERCPVESFTDGELVIRADSTAWATQLRILLPQIEKRLAEEVGEGTVTSIQVRGPGGPSWKHGRWSVTGGRGPRDTYG